MKAKDLRSNTDDELRNLAHDSRVELFNLRMKQAGGALEKPSRIRDVRKNLARIETVMSDRRVTAVDKQ